MWEIPMKNCQRLTSKKSSLPVGLVDLLDILVCSQVNLGHCILMLFRDQKEPSPRGDPEGGGGISLRHPV